MMGQIHDCRRVRRYSVIKTQLVAIVQRIDYLHVEVSRIALLAGRTSILKLKLRAAGRALRARLPNYFIKAHDASVKVISAIISRKAMNFTVQQEGSVGNPICVAADEATEVRGVC